MHRGPFAGAARHVDGAAHALDVGLRDIHAHAAAGDAGNALGRREPRPEDQLHCLALAHAGRLVGRDQAALDRLALDAREVHARPVVGDFDDDVPALMIGAQQELARRRLAARLALPRRLQAVIAGVAHQMRQRVLDRLHDGAVKLGVGPLHVELNLLAAGMGQVAHQARHHAPGHADRLHARLHHPFLELGGDQIQPLRGAGERRVVGGPRKLQNLVARQHQLAYLVHQAVEQFDVDADGRDRFAGCRRRRLCQIRMCQIRMCQIRLCRSRLCRRL